MQSIVAAASGDWSISDHVLLLSIIAEILIFIKRHAPNARNSAMKLRMDATLRFWVDVAYESIKSDHINLTKRQLGANPAKLRIFPSLSRQICSARRTVPEIALIYFKTSELVFLFSQAEWKCWCILSTCRCTGANL
jgi:hypothetical protein